MIMSVVCSFTISPLFGATWLSVVSPISSFSFHPVRQSRISTLSPSQRASATTLTMVEARNNNMPNEREIAQQRSEAYQALSSFHETKCGSSTMSELWECQEGAITYIVPMDPAAGVKRGVVSRPYRSNVQIQTTVDPSRKHGPCLIETFQFLDHSGQNSPLSSPFVRSIALRANIDVDSVDGSYSLDDFQPGGDASAPPLPLFPPSLLGGLNPTCVTFVVEHTLAVSNTERCRCFLLYADQDHNQFQNSDNYTKQELHDDAARQVLELPNDTGNRNYMLMAIVFSEESKKMIQQQQQQQPKQLSLNEVPAVNSQKQSLFYSGQSALVSVKTSKDRDRNEHDKTLNQPFRMDDRDAHPSEFNNHIGSEEQSIMERHAPGMFGISSGVWLGDTYVREGIPSKTQLNTIRQYRQRGFGNQGNSKAAAGDKQEEDRFAIWHIGVQKSSLQFQWDYSTNILQSHNYGKSIGTMTSMSCSALYKSVGTVVLNDGRAAGKREERRVVWDMDSGQYLAGLIGSTYFRAPRYMSFSRARSYSFEPYLTEFIQFYRTRSISDESVEIEYYCSRIARLYDSNDGSLMQGSTAFFSMRRPSLEEK